MQQRRFQHNRTIINSVACPQSVAKKPKTLGSVVPLCAERVGLICDRLRAGNTRYLLPQSGIKNERGARILAHKIKLNTLSHCRTVACSSVITLWQAQLCSIYCTIWHTPRWFGRDGLTAMVHKENQFFIITSQPAANLSS